MIVKALTSFCGTVTMAQNAVADIPEGAILTDLLAAGYVIPVEEEKTNASKQNIQRGGKKVSRGDKQ